MVALIITARTYTMLVTRELVMLAAMRRMIDENHCRYTFLLLSLFHSNPFAFFLVDFVVCFEFKGHGR